MARTVNVLARTVRREAFLDAAQQLIQTKGYEAMSIQDVLDALDTSRGAFYHYFESKLELLEAVVERFTDSAMTLVDPILEDPGLRALRKLEKIVAGIARLKAESKDLMLALIEVMNSDGNALFREKLRQMTASRLGPMLSRIIREGMDEGVVKVRFPDETAKVILSMIQGYQQVAGDQFMARQANRISLDDVKRSYAAFTEAVERIIGVPAGSLQLVDEATLHFWFG